MRRTKSKKLNYKNLEQRLYLTVAGSVNDAGMLWVTGDSDGDVAVVATDDGYDLTDNGVAVDSFTDVEKIGVWIDTGSDNETANNLSIDLGSNDADFVFAHAGAGDNSFDIEGTGVVGGVILHGGAGNDTVNLNVETDGVVTANLRGGDDVMTVNADSNYILFRGSSGDDAFVFSESVTADGRVSVLLGSGDNSATIDGDAKRLSVIGGSDVDTVSVGADAVFEQSVSLKVGHGDNTIDFAGTSNGNLQIQGGEDADTVTITDSAVVAERASVMLSSGDNVTSLDGFFGSTLNVYGGGGTDSVAIGASASVADDVTVNLSDGVNSFQLAGSVGGDLNVFSTNADDVFEVTGDVAGESTLGPGDQTLTSGRGYRGRFGGGFFGSLLRGLGRRFR